MTTTVCRPIATGPTCSYWLIGNDVYRVPSSADKILLDAAAFDSHGLPMGRRWECAHEHWKRFRSIYSFVVDIDEKGMLKG